MEKLDFKKQEKTLYLPTTSPALADVPEMLFIMVDGRGDPNLPDGEYTAALELLYALTYSIKMSKMGDSVPDGYFEYVVPPLEGLWWFEDGAELDFTNKDNLCWISMIRQPEFVTKAVFDWACEQVSAKKPALDTGTARFETLCEGLCVQCMHIGSYDSEAATIAKINNFTAENGLLCDLSDTRRHHEIYLGDPRKVAEAKRRTVIRHPVRHAKR